MKEEQQKQNWKSLEIRERDRLQLSVIDNLLKCQIKSRSNAETEIKC